MCGGNRREVKSKIKSSVAGSLTLGLRTTVSFEGSVERFHVHRMLLCSTEVALLEF
jgi:hypothetical protein